MAGQHEIDLRCPSTCSDIAGVKATVEGIAKRQDEHFTHIKELMRKQDDHYETLRKRIHEVVNDTNNAIGASAVRVDSDINAVGSRVRDLDGKYSTLVTDVGLLTHMVSENAQHSEERHKSIMQSLDGLKSRWWSLSVWAILSLLTLLGAAGAYIWAGRSVLP